MTDLVAAIFILMGAVQGFRKGFIRALASAVSLFGGYIAALRFGRPVGEAMSANWGLPVMISFPVGGLIVFMGIGVLIRVVALLAESALEKAWKVTDGTAYKTAGALIGMGRGAVIASLLIYGFLLAKPLIAKVKPELLSKDPTVSEKTVRWMMQRFGTKALAAATGDQDDTLGGAMASMLSRPEEAAEDLKKLTGNGSLAEAFNDKKFMRSAAEGDLEALERHPALERMLQDEDFMDTVRKLKLVSDDLPRRETKRALSKAVIEAVRRRKALSDDPAVKALMEGRMRGMVEEGLVAPE